MAKVGSVELKISRITGFGVRIGYLGGADVRADRQGLRTFPYEPAARDSWAVADWRRERFGRIYPEFDVDVLNGDGDIVTAGQTLLETVRDSHD